MKPRPWFLISLTGSALLFTGCGKKASSEEAGHDHSEHAGSSENSEEGVTFKEGRGLQIPSSVLAALNVRTAEAEDRPLTSELKVTAQVFANQPRVLATARLTAEQAAQLEKATFAGAKIVRVDRAMATATRLVDLVFELEASSKAQIGDFVSLALAAEPSTVLSVPRSSVLEGAASTFVYVVNSGAYLRTPVKVGARSSEFIEITDGLYAGDVVVVSPVDQLWLSELRLTKGGGHSH